MLALTDSLQHAATKSLDDSTRIARLIGGMPPVPAGWGKGLLGFRDKASVGDGAQFTPNGTGDGTPYDGVSVSSEITCVVRLT